MYPLSNCSYPEDVKRIIKVAMNNGILLLPLEAEKAWEEYSDSMAACWMTLPKSDDDVWFSLPSWARGCEDTHQPRSGDR